MAARKSDPPEIYVYYASATYLTRDGVRINVYEFKVRVQRGRWKALECGGGPIEHFPMGAGFAKTVKHYGVEGDDFFKLCGHQWPAVMSKTRRGALNGIKAEADRRIAALKKEAAAYVGGLAIIDQKLEELTDE